MELAKLRWGRRSLGGPKSNRIGVLAKRQACEVRDTQGKCHTTMKGQLEWCCQMPGNSKISGTTRNWEKTKNTPLKASEGSRHWWRCDFRLPAARTVRPYMLFVIRFCGSPGKVTQKITELAQWESVHRKSWSKRRVSSSGAGRGDTVRCCQRDRKGQRPTAVPKMWDTSGHEAAWENGGPWIFKNLFERLIRKSVLLHRGV